MNKFLYKIQELEDEQHLSLKIDTVNTQQTIILVVTISHFYWERGGIEIRPAPYYSPSRLFLVSLRSARPA